MKQSKKPTVSSHFEIQALEDRRMLSAAVVHSGIPHGAGHAAVGEAATATVHPMRGDIMTAAQRADLLAHLSVANGRTLGSLLRAGYTASFDQQLLNDMVTRVGPSFYFNPSDVAGDVAFDKTNTPTQVSRSIQGADATVANVNASTSTSLSAMLAAEPTWQNLVEAYRFTGNTKYTDALTKQFTLFAQELTPLSNANSWPSSGGAWDPIGTGFRANRLVYDYMMLLGTPALTPALNSLFLRNLYQLGDFLYRCTPPAATSNWTTAQARALTEIAMVFPEFSTSATWKTAGLSLLYKCIDSQIYPDGGHSEESPGYQGLVLSELIEAYRLSQLNGVAWPSREVSRLSAAAHSYYQLLEPDGNQSGLSDTFRTDGTVIISHASLILGDHTLPLAETRLRDVFLLGNSLAAQTLGAPEHPTLTNRGLDAAMPYEGYWVARSGDDANARQVIFDAGPTGFTHGHYDLLSLDLYGYGKPLIADPGPYRYDNSADRQWVLSTPAHNTISVDGKNHAEVEGVGNRAIVVDQWVSASDHVQWTAHHTAYAGLSGSPVVGRSVWYDRDGVMLVVDFGQSSASHTYTSSFNVAGSSVSASTRGGMINTTNSSGNVMVKSLLLRGQSVAARSTFISSNPAPNDRSPATRYAVSQTGTTALIANLVVAYAGATPPAVSAAWVRLPSRSGAGIIALTKNGQTQQITIPSPAGFPGAAR